MKMEAETTKSPPGSGASPLDTCGICKELFHSRDPKLLPCLHAFCRSCIVPKANDNGQLQCPVCHNECKLGDMVDWLCVTPGSQRGSGGGNGSGGDSSAQEEVHICTGCEESATASSYCTDCPEWLCDQCVQAHRRVRVTKDHTIEPKENVVNRASASSSSSAASAGSGAALPTLFCPQHLHEPLKLFCETCDKLTCRDCQLSDHKDHKYQFVTEASTQYKQFLQILLSKIKEKQTYIENAYQLIHKRHQEIEEREKVVLNDIKAFAKRLMSEVNNRGKQLVTDLHSICTAKKAQLGYKQKAIVSLSGQLDHALAMAEKILDCNSTAAMLSSKKVLVQHLKHLLRTRCEVPNPYHVVDINLRYNEEIICSHLSKQGALVVDGVTYRGPMSKSSAAAGAGPSNQAPGTSQPGPQQSQRPLQPIAPKMVPGQGPPPSLANLTADQRASLMKTIAATHLQGSNSPTSTMTNPRFPSQVGRPPPAASAPGGLPTSKVAPTSSNGANPQGKRFAPYMPVPQSNTVSSTQVVKTGGVYYPPSGLTPTQHQQQQQQQHSQQSHQPQAYGQSRRTLTVQQQLQQQRQRLQEQQQQQQRYQQHMSQIKQQMDKMVMELQRQQQPGTAGANKHQPQAAVLGGQQQVLGGQQQPAGMSGGQGMGNPSMANAIVIQPASSTAHYPISSTQPGFTSQTSIGNGRDQLTPSPNLRTSPLSQGSRNEVSPVGSLSEGHGNDSALKPTSSGGLIKQELDIYSQMIGPDGTLCIKPEPATPGVDGGPPLAYPTDLNYDDAFLRTLREKPVDLNDPEISDSAVETTQHTPPPGQQYAANQDQPYNLCKPITDQVIGCQPDDSEEVLDLSRSSSADGVKAGSVVAGSGMILGTVTLATEGEGQTAKDNDSGPLPLRDPDDPSEDYCAVCQNGGELLCCDTCPKVYHLTHHVPTLPTEPSGMWSCTLCLRESELKIEAALPRPVEAAGTKRKMSMERLLDREMKVCQRILLELFCHKASPPFHEPVPKSVPNYHKIIATPMDLSTVKAKLMRTHAPRYITIDDYLGDIQLIFSNCAVFNDPESEVGKAGKIVETFFHDIVNKYLPYFRAWTAAPHDPIIIEPKPKRRKRDPSGKEIRGAKDKSLHPEGERQRADRKSPIPREKLNRKTPEKVGEQNLQPKDTHISVAQDLTSSAKQNEEKQSSAMDTEDALIRNLGLIRSTCEQITQEPLPNPEPSDLPSDPVIDPNDEGLDSSQEVKEDDKQALSSSDDAKEGSEPPKKDCTTINTDPKNKEDSAPAPTESAESTLQNEKLSDTAEQLSPQSKPQSESSETANSQDDAKKSSEKASTSPEPEKGKEQVEDNGCEKDQEEKEELPSEQVSEQVPEKEQKDAKSPEQPKEGEEPMDTGEPVPDEASAVKSQPKEAPDDVKDKNSDKESTPDNPESVECDAVEKQKTPEETQSADTAKESATGDSSPSEKAPKSDLSSAKGDSESDSGSQSKTDS